MPAQKRTTKKTTVKRTTPTIKRPRVSVTERQQTLIDQLTNMVQVQRTARSAITLERSPRGQTVITVHVQQGDEPGLDTLAAVEKRATELYNRLAVKYPVVEYS